MTPNTLGSPRRDEIVPAIRADNRISARLMRRVVVSCTYGAFRGATGTEGRRRLGSLRPTSQVVSGECRAEQSKEDGSSDHAGLP
jgi:hypothetical protein